MTQIEKTNRQMRNIEIYNEWCEYQISQGKPEPEHGPLAYTQSTIDTWERIMNK